MAYSTGQNRVVAYKAQSGLGVPASGGSGFGLRFNQGSPGLRLTKPPIANNESGSDGMSRRGRHGSRSVGGSYAVNLMHGDIDTLLEAVMRSTWTALVTLTEASGAPALTSITTGTATIIAAAGSWIQASVRVGDMVKLANHATAANNGKWFPVLGLTASTITVPAGSLTLDAAPDAAWSLAIAKNVGQGTTERYFTFDEHDTILDRSLQGTDVKVNKLDISAQPNEHIIATIGLIGLDLNALAVGASPSLTSPVFSTSLPLVMADGVAYVSGTPYADITGFSLSLDLGGNVPGVLAPNAPDAFLGNALLSGQVTGLRNDLARFEAFDAETQISFFLNMKENEAQPTDFVSLYVGNAVYDGNDAALGQVGALVETVPWRAGKDEAGGGAPATMIKLATSAA